MYTQFLTSLAGASLNLSHLLSCWTYYSACCCSSSYIYVKAKQLRSTIACLLLYCCSPQDAHCVSAAVVYNRFDDKQMFCWCRRVVTFLCAILVLELCQTSSLLSACSSSSLWNGYLTVFKGAWKVHVHHDSDRSHSCNRLSAVW
jgi:hypothetical protein